MAEKKIKTRIQHKRGTLADWQTASANGFKPLAGELIIYTDENGHDRVKIGDGTTVVGNLPFLGDNKIQLITWESDD